MGRNTRVWPFVVILPGATMVAALHASVLRYLDLINLRNS